MFLNVMQENRPVQGKIRREKRHSALFRKIMNLLNNYARMILMMRSKTRESDTRRIRLACNGMLVFAIDSRLKNRLISPMSRPYFFGYGSLVNIHTHTYGETSTAELQGWRRVWQMTPLRPHPFLSIEPQDGCAIQGLIAHVPDGDWAQLDAREYGYDRLSTDRVKHARDDDPELAIYVVPKPASSLRLEKGPILLSYLDVVIQGFLKEFGESGVRAFFDTTAGWDHPIDNDRDVPKYPRHQKLSPHETAMVDAELKRLGISI